MAAEFEYDSNRFYLGRLCKNGHSWGATGQSLRRKGYRACIQCQLEANRKSYWKYREKNLAQGRKYYQEHRDETRAKHAKYYQEHKEDWRKRHKRHTGTPQRREIIRRYMSKFRQTPAGRAAIKRARFRRRAYRSSKDYVPYNSAELLARFNEFSDSCAYCGSTNSLEVDHFIALSAGGADAITNLVPACHSCNASKRDKDPLSWYTHQQFFSKERWELILQVLGKP